MFNKLKELGNLPLVIILVIVIVIALVLSIIKAQNTESINANTNNTEVGNQEEQEEEKPDVLIVENVQEIIDETEEIKENIDAKYFIKVNYGQNVVTIYTKDAKGKYTVPYKAMVCSTGTATPKSGTYTIPSGDYSRGTWGLMVGNVWAQYFTRIKGSILFHSVPYLSREKNNLEYWEYDKLGTTASAGCVRLTVEDAKWIYNNCPAGTQVEFYTDSNPGPLGKPEAKKISEEEAVRTWDPTDPDANNPWKTYKPVEEEPEKIEDTEETTKPTEQKPNTNKPNTNKPNTNKPSTSTTPDKSEDKRPTEENKNGETTEPSNPSEGAGEETQKPGEGEGSNPGTQTPSEGEGSNPGTQKPSEGEGSNTGTQTPSEGEGSTPGTQTPSEGEESNSGTQKPSEGTDSNPGTQTPNEGTNSNNETQTLTEV